MSNGIPFDEQETVIIIPVSRVSKTAEVYTCVPGMLKKLRDWSESRPDCVRIKQDMGDALFADVDSSCIKVSPRRRMSEEQRAAASERLARGRAMKT